MGDCHFRAVWIVRIFSINGDSILLTFTKWNLRNEKNDQTISQYCGSGEARDQILFLSKYRKIRFVKSEKVAMRRTKIVSNSDLFNNPKIHFTKQYLHKWLSVDFLEGHF